MAEDGVHLDYESVVESGRGLFSGHSAMKIMSRGTRVTGNKKAHVLWGCLFALCISSAQGLDYFAENGIASLNLRQHPSIATSGNRTYVAYQGPGEDPYVCSYDHGTGIWEGPVLAGTSLLRDGDNHGKPTIAIDDAGYIHIVFGGHGGYNGLPGDNREYSFGKNPGPEMAGKQTHMRSDSPHDISSWTEMQCTTGYISGYGTYSQLIKMDDGDMYLFYRHGRHPSDWTYQRSTDNGLSWEPEVIIMDAIESYTKESWYMWFDNGPGDTIICGYSFHPHTDCTGHRENVYYMRMNCSDHSWENAAGEILSMPLVKAKADAHTLAYNSGGVMIKEALVRLDPDGKPWMIFPWSVDDVYKCVRWTGETWMAPSAIDGSMNKQEADLMVLSETSAKLLMMGNNPATSKWSVSWYETADAGETWRLTSSIFSETSPHQISSLYLDGHPDAQFLIGGLRTGKMYLYGESGFVPRPAP